MGGETTYESRRMDLSGLIEGIVQTLAKLLLGGKEGKSIVFAMCGRNQRG